MAKKRKCFEFFTLGGSQRWEDVFFYQKWRIQRNYKTKQYRLLDNWDIRRAEGSFDDCYKSFVKYIEIYQLSRQHGHMVIMLHGLAQSKNMFQPLWRAITSYGLMAAAINYPSTYKRVDAHVRQLDFFLNHLEDVSEVSFIVYGSGALILRKLLYFDAAWKKKIKIGKIIEINPLSKGCVLYQKLGKYKLWRKILGPILADLSPSSAQKIPEYNPQYKVGIIRCKTIPMKLCSWLPKKIRKILPFSQGHTHGHIREIQKIKSNTFTVLSNLDVVSKCILFLKDGAF